ncbi:DUF1924 domain-containing protein [Pseudogulbenkiania ferrooxidans]|uniref:Cytochrome c domain-containing protein n=1 Tax=Pseudogulbenkiania ferrooxidans 2002 TaxID=279714 RepID=B9Z6M8_9NEIS|nr:DUF1924 domain-containing protein [Pseudogulbenkiania ferrooxidans]EEG07603.1 protein of unknown function DUF1924 [Pseudogulbenkiania ferrooxidans 2002]
MSRLFLLLLAASLAPLAQAASSPAELLQGYAAEARQAAPGFSGFSAERGKELYYRRNTKDGKAISCASCHSDDPRRSGMTPSFRKIGPMASAVNPERFRDPAKVEKWFRRNCDDVLSRACTPLEKGDFLTFLTTLR